MVTNMKDSLLWLQRTVHETYHGPGPLADCSMKTCLHVREMVAVLEGAESAAAAATVAGVRGTELEYLHGLMQQASKDRELGHYTKVFPVTPSQEALFRALPVALPAVLEYARQALVCSVVGCGKSPAIYGARLQRTDGGAVDVGLCEEHGTNLPAVEVDSPPVDAKDLPPKVTAMGVDLASGNSKTMMAVQRGRGTELDFAFEVTPEREEIMRSWARSPPGDSDAAGKGE